MLTRSRTETVAHPHESGVTFEFKMLSWKELEQARQASVQASFKTMSEMGSGILASIRDVEPRDDGDADDDTEPDFDRGVLLHLGIVDWSYDEDLTEENINDLDDPTAEWAEGEILRLSRRTDSEGEVSSGA